MFQLSSSVTSLIVSSSSCISEASRDMASSIDVVRRLQYLSARRMQCWCNSLSLSLIFLPISALVMFGNTCVAFNVFNWLMLWFDFSSILMWFHTRVDTPGMTEISKFPTCL